MEFFIKTFKNPLVAFLPFGIILLQYFGKFKIPFRIPGGLLSIFVGTTIAWLSGFWGKPMMSAEVLQNSFSSAGFFFPTLTISDLFDVFTFSNLKEYASVIIPMGIFNVIGSLQNIESAEACGDKFDTKSSLLVNGAGSILGSLMGSPFPTTIYIGHPGWKALGARSGYSLLNGVFMTFLCFSGLMGFVQALIPIEAGMAIILWIGIVMGSQAFSSTPKEHSPAVVLGLFPAIVAWGALLVQSSFNYADGALRAILQNAKVGGDFSISLQSVPVGLEFLPYGLSGLFALSQGFLLTSMVWASITAFIIDRNFSKAGHWSLVAALLSAIGIIHSYQFSGNAILNQFSLFTNKDFIIGYLMLASLFYLANLFDNAKSDTQ